MCFLTHLGLSYVSSNKTNLKGVWGKKCKIDTKSWVLPYFLPLLYLFACAKYQWLWQIRSALHTLTYFSTTHKSSGDFTTVCYWVKNLIKSKNSNKVSWFNFLKIDPVYFWVEIAQRIAIWPKLWNTSQKPSISLWHFSRKLFLGGLPYWQRLEICKIKSLRPIILRT